MKTFEQWKDVAPGFLQSDCVGHDGGNGSGEFNQTLDMTDVATTWTETRAVKNKAHVWVLEAIKTLLGQFPFPVKGIHSDSGGEFINAALRTMGYDTKEDITGHGFRATARTLIRELLGWDREVIERHLGRSEADALADIESVIGRPVPADWIQRWGEVYGTVFDTELEAVPGVDPRFQVIPTYLSRVGLRRWELYE